MVEIEFYDTEDGRTPVQEFLDSFGFVKKTQKTPPAAIELARKYKADYERRFRR